MRTPAHDDHGRLEPKRVLAAAGTVRLGRRPRLRARSAALAPVHLRNGRARRPQILGIPTMFKHNRTLLALATVSLCAGALPAQAAVKVLATTPDWGALVTQLGGDKVNVYTATSALQDVHRVDAKPSLVARARTADLVVATGAALEIGWIPVLPESNPAAQATSRPRR